MSKRGRKKKTTAPSGASAAGGAAALKAREEDDLKLADELVKSANQTMTSSHSIISAQALPFLAFWDIGRVTQRFGAARMERYLSHIKESRKIRMTLNQLLATCPTGRAGLYEKSLTLSLATSRFGIGECGEMSNYCVRELIKRGRTDFALVTLLANPKERSGGEYYHQVLILGDSRALRNRGAVAMLNTLPKGVLILDPLIQYAGPANTYLREQRAYVERFGYHTLLRVHRFTPAFVRRDLPQIDRDVEYIVTKGLERGLIAYDRDKAIEKEVSYLVKPLAGDLSTSKVDAMARWQDELETNSIRRLLASSKPVLLFDVKNNQIKPPAALVSTKPVMPISLLLDDKPADYSRFFRAQPGSAEERLALSELKAGP